MRYFTDLTGKKFGKLRVVRRTDKNKNGYWQWLCKCDCGNTTITTGSCLMRGVISSCKRCNSITYCGKTQTVAEWSRELGLSHSLLEARLESMSVEKAFLKPREVASRKNASNERRLVLLAIEGISSTKTARERGLGATSSQIIEYTKLSKRAVNAGISWLRKKGVICSPRWGHWMPKGILPDGFCFSHGIYPNGRGGCLKCDERPIISKSINPKLVIY